MRRWAVNQDLGRVSFVTDTSDAEARGLAGAAKVLMPHLTD
jgi:hypothetical protein